MEPPAFSTELDISPEADALRLLEEVRTGARDVEELSDQPASMQRRFEAMLGMA